MGGCYPVARVCVDRVEALVHLDGAQPPRLPLRLGLGLALALAFALGLGLH